MDMDERIRAKMFGHAHGPLPGAFRGRDFHVLGAHTDRLGAMAGRIRPREEVHLRRSDEPGHEQVARRVIQLHRATDLFDHTGLQNHDLVGHGHRFDLIVRDVDHRRGQALVQLGNLQPHPVAQRRIQVRQRFVEQKGRRFTHDGAADGHALALTAGKLAGAAVQIVGQVQRLGGGFDPALLLGLVDLGHAHREGDVLAHGHMRIQGVGLENHGQPALGRRQRGRVLPVNHDPAAAHVFQTGDQPQQGGFAAARRPDEDHELSVFDRQIQRRDDFRFAEGFADFFEYNASHLGLPYFTAPKVRPRTSCFWLNQPMIRIGAMAMVDAALSLAKNNPSGLE